MDINEFDYELPLELISQCAIDKRDESKLLIYDKSENFVSHKKFYDIIDYLKEGDVLVMNETKVIPCVFYGKKKTGSPVKLSIINLVSDNRYVCRIKTKNPKVSRILEFDNFSGEIVKDDDGVFVVEFSKDISDEIRLNAKLLLPEYVKDPDSIDADRYQTVYAKKDGSLAAPTAGLHFTKELLDKIIKKGVKIAKVCLHVSYGTFLPIRVKDVMDHKMEEEYFEIKKDACNLINNAKRLFVVGTTSFKTLESCDWVDGKIVPSNGYSNLFITPKHKVKTPIHGFITNFHLPKSTLLLLVCSLVEKKKLLNVYRNAIEKKYRFYSFGDCMMILN